MKTTVIEQRNRWPSRWLVGVCLLATVTSAFSQVRTGMIDPGKREFDNNCASCHGTDGKGNGHLVMFLTKSPPDLTLLAKKNGGILPVARLYDVIDGADVPIHGSREMPVWGRDYRVKDAEYYVDTPYNAESAVRARILTLVEYIHRLQAK